MAGRCARMPAAKRADGAEPTGPLWLVEYRMVLQVQEAQVDVDTVAYTLRIGLRYEARPVAEPAGHFADDLPHSGGPVGTRDTLRRRAGNLKLPFSVLGEEHLRLQAGLAQGGEDERTEGLDEPLGLQREARSGLLAQAFQNKLLLEGGDQAKPGLFEPGEGAFEQRPRA